jgi:B12-binding domain/radical SAM domain protein
VDYIVRGDSAEEPLRQLLSAIKEGRSPEDIPNITWKEEDRVRINQISHSPSNIDDIPFDYRTVMRSTVRNLDPLGPLPFKEWPWYPIVCALSCRGCVHNCVICGGSSSAYGRTAERKSAAFRRPELLARDIGLAARYIKAPAIVLGDILQAGEKYAERFLDGLKAEKIRNHIALEFFAPPPRRILERVMEAIPNFNIQISPESHDEAIRKRFGRPYDNAALEKMMADALDVGCKRLDMFFMIGLPGQTPQSVRDTIGYCQTLLERFGRDQVGWLHPYISPLAPFLDPGSRAFEEPEKYGYRLFFRTLEEHRHALAAPSWKYTLNYETEWMSRDEIAQVTYEAAFELNRLKMEYRLQSQKTGERIEKRIEAERGVLRRIDDILVTGDGLSRENRIEELMCQFDCVGPSTICHEHEMKWPVRFLRFNPLRILQGLLARPV